MESDSNSSVSSPVECFRENLRFSEENNQQVRDPLNDHPSSPRHQLSSSSRKGLSKHYSGKSQSFTSLSDVKTLEDLAKQENPFNIKMMRRRREGSCGSSGGIDQNPPLPRRRNPPLRAHTLTAAHLSALLS